MNTLLAVYTYGDGGAKGLVIQFLIAVLIVGAVGGLIWCIEKWINPIPHPGKPIIAIILAICLIIWAVNTLL